MSLSRLWQQQGKRAETYELLASIYGWCTEGFDTADLQEAKALLEELQGETWRAQHVAETQRPIFCPKRLEPSQGHGVKLPALPSHVIRAPWHVHQGFGFQRKLKFGVGLM
jgi:hypothetical protein